MSLIPCPDCKKEISRSAVECPECGYPLQKKLKEFSEKRSKNNANNQNQNKGNRFVRFMIGGIVLFAILTFVDHEIKKQKELENERRWADLRNQKDIAHALEMYWLDHNKYIIIKSKEDLKLLMKEKYLDMKEIPQTPGCEDDPVHYFSDKVGNVWSVKYGSSRYKFNKDIEAGGFLTPEIAAGTGKCNNSQLIAYFQKSLSE